MKPLNRDMTNLRVTIDLIVLRPKKNSLEKLLPSPKPHENQKKQGMCGREMVTSLSHDLFYCF